ncbi:MAG: hypothetical protein GXP43_02315 [bacterium]|nr:hypothetical protein [bacterium]
MPLTDRQIQILKYIIEEFITTARPVGSQVLEDKYHVGVSPATIRNEMASLTQENLLFQPHTSAGRVPTTQAMRFYVRNLIRPEEGDVSAQEEVSFKARLYPKRHNLEDILEETVGMLAESLQSVAVASSDEDEAEYAGLSYLLDYPEFLEINLTRQVLALLDEEKRLWEIFNLRKDGEEVVTLIGEELGQENLYGCGLVYAPLDIGPHISFIGILGPYRMDYKKIIARLKLIRRLIVEMIKES